MITGSHVVIFTRDAEADRAFFRDTLQMPVVDAGQGWLLFSLPPAEVAFHPSDKNDKHELYLMCDDLPATRKYLIDCGVLCGEMNEESWGITTEVHLPGGGRIGLYQPLHPTAI